MTTNEGYRFSLLEVDVTAQEVEALRVQKLQTTVAGQLQLRQEKAEQGNWLPSNGGTETPFVTRTGRTLLYCWQPTTGRHAYLDCGTDLILSDEEARNAIAIF